MLSLSVFPDFIFDLSDSVTLSQIPEEQSKLYSVTFRELCNKVRGFLCPVER